MTREVKLYYKKILKATMTFLLIILAVFLGIKVAIFFLPFLIAYVISNLIKRPVNFLHRKLKIPKILGVIFMMIIFVAIVVALIYFLFAPIFSELSDLSESVQEIDKIKNTIKYQIGRFDFFVNDLNFSEDLVKKINDAILSFVDEIFTTLTGWITKAGGVAVNVIMNFPVTLVYIIITILSTFFMSCDSKYIGEALEKYLPLKWLRKAQDISNGLFHSLGSYLKAIGILITITFCELLIGFTLFKIDHAIILALAIALIDALPILGTGTVLIPWGIFLLATGNYSLGFGIIGLYLLILVVRQLIEPKVVGKQIGVYPLLTLLAMYTGVKFFGLAGVIIGPIVLIILKNVFSSVYGRGTLKDLFGN